MLWAKPLRGEQDRVGQGNSSWEGAGDRASFTALWTELVSRSLGPWKLGRLTMISEGSRMRTGGTEIDPGFYQNKAKNNSSELREGNRD